MIVPSHRWRSSSFSSGLADSPGATVLAPLLIRSHLIFVSHACKAQGQLDALAPQPEIAQCKGAMQ
eukprot:2357707-Prymnesium_polylepis.1